MGWHVRFPPKAFILMKPNCILRAKNICPLHYSCHSFTVFRGEWSSCKVSSVSNGHSCLSFFPSVLIWIVITKRMLKNATPTNFQHRKYAKPRRHQISRTKVRWNVCACVKISDRAKPTENQRRREMSSTFFGDLHLILCPARRLSSFNRACSDTHRQSQWRRTQAALHDTAHLGPSLSICSYLRPPPPSRTSLSRALCLSSTAFCPLLSLLLCLLGARWT